MKQFNLEEFKENPSRKVVTRNGRRVRIVCTDKKGALPIVGLVLNGGCEFLYTYSKTGKSYSSEREVDCDLFFAPTKHEGYINIYEGNSLGDVIFNTKEDAERKGKSHNDCVTIKIEWEE